MPRLARTARNTPKDERGYSGVPSVLVELPTFAIPEHCHDICTWVVVRPGVSRLKYTCGACEEKHQPAVPAEASGD